MAIDGELRRYGFSCLSTGGWTFYLVPELAAAGAAAAGQMLAASQGTQHGLGNRRSAVPFRWEGLAPMYVRRSRRGGWLRHLSSELYAGTRPRPLTELLITLRARERDIPVAEPLGAAVRRLAPGFYRGLFITAAIAGRTLWQCLETQPDAAARREILVGARTAIELAHVRGLFHADLNLHNLLLIEARRPPAIMLLDLDKARLYPGSLPRRLAAANWRRLRRSAGKLRGAAALSPSELALLYPGSG